MTTATHTMTYTAPLPLPPWAARLGVTGLWRHDRKLHGAIHWGLAMRGALTPQPGPFVWGVFPSLVAWVVLLLPVGQGLVTLALLLGMCLAVDRRSYPAYGLSLWLPMRLHLTVAAAVSLLAGSLAV